MRELKAEMLRRGVRQKDIAIRLGVTPSLVCKVVSGASKSSRVIQALREAGIPESVLSDRWEAA